MTPRTAVNWLNISFFLALIIAGCSPPSQPETSPQALVPSSPQVQIEAPQRDHKKEFQQIVNFLQTPETKKYMLREFNNIDFLFDLNLVRSEGEFFVGPQNAVKISVRDFNYDKTNQTGEIVLNISQTDGTQDDYRASLTASTSGWDLDKVSWRFKKDSESDWGDWKLHNGQKVPFFKQAISVALGKGAKSS